MVFDRPPDPRKKSQSKATQRPNSKSPSKKKTTVGGSRSGNKGGGSSHRYQKQPEGSPSPWLGHPCDRRPEIEAYPSFVEYLRWMRSPEAPEKDSTKVQILQEAMNRANYGDMLSQRIERTRLMAGADNCFEVSCPWRIRVGGQKGPENILLPAFDAIGMPYIPSATLCGIARTQAIREFMQKNGDTWQQAEEKVVPWFGSLEEKGSDRTGKVIFFDAYPFPASASASGNMSADKHPHSGGLMLDMANNIWQWSEDELAYKSNPNPFLSLHKPTFIIGLRQRNQSVSEKVVHQVKKWLIAGLANGVGAQVNTGYGVLVSNDAENVTPFLQVPFTLEGQLIHGYQTVKWVKKEDKYKRKYEWKANTSAKEEMRPVAFKSMMRYWFRALATGVLPVGDEQDASCYRQTLERTPNAHPPKTVKALEAILFGSITPQFSGWLTVRAAGETVISSSKRDGDPCGQQVGNLALLFSAEMPGAHTSAVRSLCQSLVWLMFHLGGVGQGARRPRYSRSNRQYPPRYRGAMLNQGVPTQFGALYGQMTLPDNDSDFWTLPDSIFEFRDLFRDRLSAFYSALEQLTNTQLSYSPPTKKGKPTAKSYEWAEAVDQVCKIVVVRELDNDDKPTALKLLHEQFHELEKGNLHTAKNLCGHTKEDHIPLPRQKRRPITQKEKKKQAQKKQEEKLKRKAIPSPIWIADLSDQYQVVTVFGASQNPRKQFLNDLEENVSSRNIAQIWPIV